MQLQLNIRSVLFAGLLLAALPGAAQEIPSRPNEGVRRTESKREQYNGYQQLGLTADQKTRLVALQKEGKAGLAAIRNNTTLSKTAQKEQLQALQQQLTQKRNTILTPEQQKLWKEADRGRNKQANVTVDQRRKAPGSTEDRNALPAATDKTAAKIKLSAAQEQKMEALKATYKEQARVIRQDQTLSADEKKARIGSLKKEARKKQKALLTPAQWQQWVKQDRNRNSISKK